MDEQNPQQNSSQDPVKFPSIPESQAKTQPNEAQKTEPAQGQTDKMQQPAQPNEAQKIAQEQGQTNQMQQQPVQQTQAGQAQPSQQSQPGQTQPQKPVKGQASEAQNAIKKKKKGNGLLLGCFGAIAGFFILVFVIFALLIVQYGTKDNPVLELLGIETTNIYHILSQLTNILFAILIFILFLLAIIGIFRFSMAKKDDRLTQKKGLTMSLISSVLFIILLFLWFSIYFYLKERIPESDALPVQFYTDPEETIGLTAPLQISFDATTIPIDETRFKVLAYQWDFGDELTGLGPTVKHTYKRKGENDGRYNVALTVTYRDLETGKEGQEKFYKDVIFENEKVMAAFSVSEEKGESPFKVLFDASQSLDPDGEIVAYEWDFDDNNEFNDANGVQTSETFELIGKYRTKLRVTDNNGETDVAERIIEVLPKEEITAVISTDSFDGSYYMGTEYTFEGGNSWSPNGDIEKYSWDFGDGSKGATTRTIKHTFLETGPYAVMLKVTDESGASGKTNLEIVVGEPEAAPKPVLQTVPVYTDEQGKLTLSGPSPLNVQFDASGSLDEDNNIIDYQWDFDGDGEIDDIGAQVTHKFEEIGEYLVTLFVIDAKNNQSTLKLIVTVGEAGLKAYIEAEPIDGVQPLTVSFDASSSTYPEGKIVAYEWNFGDGTPAKIGDAAISYRYEKIGAFKAQVTVTASDGKKDEAFININVRPIPVTACFEPDKKEGPAPLTVTFSTSCSSGAIIKYTWDFGGETSRDHKPTITFENPGEYEVTLEVADQDNVIDTYTDTIIVTQPTISE